MARVKSIFQAQGSMGNTTFVMRGNKNYAYDKIVVSDRRRYEDSSFAVTRKNAAELGDASLCAKLIREGLSRTLLQARDSGVANRLNAEMMKVLKKPGKNVAYAAVVLPEHMDHLLGFNFNKKVRLRPSFNVPIKTIFNRDTGEVTINIAAFRPASTVKGPKHATHVRIISIALELDFANKFGKGIEQSSEVFALDDLLIAPITFSHNLTPGTKQTLFHVMGLQFIDTHGFYYNSDEKMCKVNPLSIVGLDKGEYIKAIPMTQEEAFAEKAARDLRILALLEAQKKAAEGEEVGAEVTAEN